jgi:hypothetical protein
MKQIASISRNVTANVFEDGTGDETWYGHIIAVSVDPDGDLADTIYLVTQGDKPPRWVGAPQIQSANVSALRTKS